MNFTKEYISLCKNKKVQELRITDSNDLNNHLSIDFGDWFCKRGDDEPQLNYN